MHPVVRTFGKLLRLVGISSPEDFAAKVKAKGDPPSWRDEVKDLKKAKENAAS